MTSIRLHPEFGANPTLPLCFWCGKERGDIALLGAACKTEAPMHMCIDYDPCPACAAIWAQGVALLEGKRRDTHDREYRMLGPWEFTGRYVVMDEDAVRRVFQPQEVVDDLLNHRKAVMPPDLFTALIERAKRDGAIPEHGHA